MSTHLESSTKRGRSVLYIVAMVLLVVFAVIGLLMFGRRGTPSSPWRRPTS